MRFLVDMNLSPAIAEWLRGQGHDAIHVADAGLGELPDAAIFARAASDGRIVVTFDLDFGELAAAMRQGGGVILLRLRTARQDYIRNRLGVALTQAGDAAEAGAIVLVEDSRIRIRRLSEQEEP